MERQGRQLASGVRMTPHHKTEAEIIADDEQAEAAYRQHLVEIARHDGHEKRQSGRCVYCAECGVRLYQGRLPEAEQRPAPAPPPLRLLGRVPRAER